MNQHIKVDMKPNLSNNAIPATSDGEAIFTVPPPWYKVSMKMREERIAKSLSARDDKFMLHGSVKPLGAILEDIDQVGFLIDTFGLCSKRPIIGLCAVEKSRIDELLKSAIETLTKDGPGNIIMIDSLLEEI